MRNDFSDIQFSVVGPIEICVDGRYETLCDIGWDELDAQALCYQLVAFDACKQLNNIFLSLTSLCLSLPPSESLSLSNLLT